MAANNSTSSPYLIFEGQPPESPLEKLTAEQQKLHSSLRQQVDKEFKDPSKDLRENLFDDSSLYRYLKATNWSVQNAFDRLEKTKQWRETFRPNEITFEAVRDQALQKSNYVNGFDMYGRPVIYLKKVADKHQDKDPEEGFKLLIFCLERAIKVMPPTVHQLVVIMDFTLYSESKSIPLNIAKRTIDTLANHYPERLGLSIMYNAPWVFSMFFNMVQPFLDKVTKEKIKFVKKKMADSSSPFAIIPADLLETTYGGNLPFDYDHDQYYQRTKELDLLC
ncbi:CRAL/TRIO domain-containing protein [Basidiobolus meristosporus CBS 931.73]|uniref:CRAL/TRIO domain-containing protein n=1 Tax=Basidiobolus meristosporus CBS 931.73 TaxID=1314790 RepID=A0A1Y1YVQ1_9FUNG|nr:CRAL/TRIO domain-containing protein [Basidiobolus meristosporus CBS 931.73]|eukprot:ORY02110.1 CRAL/TRIO domain-containing protein [Basidiobolus meristosporus CBS 931.73]